MKTIKRNFNSNLHNEIQKYLTNNKKYNYPIVQKFLRDIYNWVCCYCESRFDFSAYSEIEHFYPKSVKEYKIYERNISNLHYSCPRCNRLKWDDSPWKYWKKIVKIYSPNFVLSGTDFIFPEFKVEDNFYYDNYEIKFKNNIAEWTIELFDLNWEDKRIFLKEERIRVYDKALQLSEEINKLIDIKNIKLKGTIKYLLQELSNMMKENTPYSTMIKEQFWEIYIKLYEKY